MLPPPTTVRLDTPLGQITGVLTAGSTRFVLRYAAAERWEGATRAGRVESVLYVLVVVEGGAKADFHHRRSCSFDLLLLNVCARRRFTSWTTVSLPSFVSR